MRDRAGRIRALALTLVLALGLLPSAVLAQSAVDGGQAESMADTQDAVVEAVADADQADASDEEDLPDVVVPAEEEDIVADDEIPAESSSDVEAAPEPTVEPSGEPAAEPEAPSDGEPMATRGGEDTTTPESREAGHMLTVRLGENSSQVQSMSMSYYDSNYEKKTAIGTTEITADVRKDGIIYVTLTMQGSTQYFVRARGTEVVSSLSNNADGAITVTIYLNTPDGLESDPAITLDLIAMHEIRTDDAEHMQESRYAFRYGVSSGGGNAAPAGVAVGPYFSLEEGYRLASYTVTDDATGETASYEVGQTFTMPASDVTVTPTIVELGPQYELPYTLTVRLGENSSQVESLSMTYRTPDGEWETVEGTTEITVETTPGGGGPDSAPKYSAEVTITMKDGRRYFAKADRDGGDGVTGVRCYHGFGYDDGMLKMWVSDLGSDATITLHDFVAASYGIKVGETEHGSISRLEITYGNTSASFSPEEDAILAPEGAQISLVSNPDEGYYFKSCTVTDNETGESIEYPVPWPDGSAIALSFTMPGSNVTVTPIFAPITVINTIEINNVSVDISASNGEPPALVPFTGTVDPDAPYTLRPDDGRNTYERWTRMSDGESTYGSPDAQWNPAYQANAYGDLTSIAAGDELSYSFCVELEPGCKFADQVTVRVTTTTGETYTRIYAGNKIGSTNPVIGNAPYAHALAYDVFRVTVGEAKPPAITVTIAFDANGGDASSVPGSQDKVVGEDLTLPTSTPARPDTTAPGYTVSYDANGGSGAPSAQTATVTTSYSFTGWNTLQDGTGDPYEAGGTYSADADATLYAQWSATAVAQPLVVAGTPVRDGHTFKGWNTSADGSGTPYAVGDPIDPAEDLTLYAQWEQDATAPTEDTYAVSSGDNGTWTQGSGEDYELTVDRVGDNDACFEHFRAVELDGRLLSEDEYEARSGSTIITLKAHVLQELSPGKHTVTVVFDDDRVDIDFTVKAASSGGSSEPGGTTPETPGTPGTPSTAPATTGGSAQAPDAEKPQATPRTGDGSPSLLAFGLALASIVMACAGFGVRSMVSKERL